MNWIDVLARLILALIFGSLLGWLRQQSMGGTVTLIGVIFLSSLVWLLLFPGLHSRLAHLNRNEDIGVK